MFRPKYSIWIVKYPWEHISPHLFNIWIEFAFFSNFMKPTIWQVNKNGRLQQDLYNKLSRMW